MMKRILLAVVLCALSGPAWAVCAVSNLQVKDNAAVTALVPYSDDGSGGSNCIPGIHTQKWGGGVLGAMANYGTSPGVVLVPGVNASVTSSVLPTGGATAANQATEISSLATIATNTGAAVPAGTATIGGVFNGYNTYQAVAASLTAAVLQTATGAAGDYVSHCIIYPTSTSPGPVTVFDSTNTAANSAILFPGGASSVSNLVPIVIAVGAKSVNGAWKVTTGSAVSAVCVGHFS